MVVSGTAVYAGTLGQGLVVYNRGSGRWTRVTRGLPSLNVTALAATHGQIYVGTDNGLLRISDAAIAAQTVLLPSSMKNMLKVESE